MICPRSHYGPWARPEGFTLLEVTIATGIFFMVAFAVLGVVAQCLAAARKLEQRDPDPALLATQFAVTNLITEGTDSGDFEESYPGLFPGWRWSVQKYPVYGETNGIFQVDILVVRDSRQGRAERSLSIQVFSPESVNAVPGRRF